MTTIPNDIQWCLDPANDISFKNFIDTFNCLDRHQAQQRYANILSKYFNTKSERDMTIKANYKPWISSADYLRFWGKKKNSISVMKADLAGAELIDSVLDLRLAPTDDNIPTTLIETNNSVHQATADCNKAIGNTHVLNDDDNTNRTTLASNGDMIILHEDTSPVYNSGTPWMFKNTNLPSCSRLIKPPSAA
ncbi:hypothetical protein BJV82DRAFT_677073 [Fennellomyces sp. T-0311]|nr:hypothetical protein BJV82DRAFT_677073 [Fennellomyces sp. T-0311]